MAIDSGYFETTNNDMETDDVAMLLVKIYAEYMVGNGGHHNEDYARAVGIAIRMLTD